VFSRYVDVTVPQVALSGLKILESGLAVLVIVGEIA